jgi:LysM repeat protein/GH25 family lysozyme M1 (1,4-beta-N-acetylmuramidase)
MTLHGIDVSGWQAGIDLAAVPSDFVIIKATGGTSFVNPECDTQFQGARRAGRRTGVYHFAHEVGCAGSAVDEANHFVDSIQGYLDGRTLLVLDFEGDNQLDTGWAKTWLDTVHARTGVKPLIYLNGAALKGADWAQVWAGDYGLWLAWYAVSTATQGYNDYTGTPIDEVTPPFPCAMWQFTSTARLDGYGASLDANVFYGDGAAWDAYCSPSGAPVKAPAPKAAPNPVQPPAPAPRPAPAAVAKCIVEAGDTLGGIARQFGVDLGALIAVNEISDPDRIYPGQVLVLPGKAAPSPSVHSGPAQCVVEAGDSVSAIARQFGVSASAIISLNNLADPDLIYPGQVLRLR